MHPAILALTTAVPKYKVPQHEIAEKQIDLLSLVGQKGEDLKKLYQNSAIKTRYSVVSDFQNDEADQKFLGQNYPQEIPGMSKRNEIYKKEAPILAKKVAAKALEDWGGDPSEITHVISVSCTGVVAPGLEFELMQHLNLKRSVNRLGINFMGCFGAFKGLSVAQSFAKENPQHRILLVCTELCSLHFQAEQNLDNVLANSLFSDGAAAVIVGMSPLSHEKSLWRMHRHYSLGVDDTLDKMTWEASDHGFLMTLSSKVPVLLGRHIHPFITSLLGSDASPSDCDWAIHPGGKSILQAIEKAINLNKDQTQASWNTLANYGNMSSATFLFVLDELQRQQNTRKWAVGIGFGPGLSMEGILLSKT